MVELLGEVFSVLSLAIETIGAVTVVVAVVRGLWPYVATFFRHQPPPPVMEVRNILGRGLVLSLEIFIAADLLRTILQPTLQEVAVLVVITILRTILSLSLEYELRQSVGGDGTPEPDASMGQSSPS